MLVTVSCGHLSKPLQPGPKQFTLPLNALLVEMNPACYPQVPLWEVASVITYSPGPLSGQHRAANCIRGGLVVGCQSGRNL